MPAPASSMVVTNSQAPIVGTTIWVNGFQIAPQGSKTFATGEIAAVCADLNFWANFLGGLCTVTMNGTGIPNSGPTVAFLVSVALGTILPT